MKQRVLQLMLIGLVILMTPSIYSQEKQRKSVEVEIVEPLLYNVEEVIHKSQHGYLCYEDQMYVSLDEICTLLGKSYSVDKNIVQLVERKDSVQHIKPLAFAYYTDALIEDINLKEKVLTLQINNEQGARESIVLALIEDTKITHQTLPHVFPIDVLKKGMYITTIVQTDQIKKGHRVALSIILQESSEAEAVDTVLQNTKILEVNEEKKYIHVVLSEKHDEIESIIVHVDHHTDIRYQTTNKEALLSDLREGMSITVRTNNILTKSIPPHTIGLEVQIL